MILFCWTGVIPGAAKPLLRPVRTCPEIHGESGLDGARLPQPTVRPLLGKAVNVMFDAISKRFRWVIGRSFDVCRGIISGLASLCTVFLYLPSDEESLRESVYKKPQRLSLSRADILLV